MKVIKKITGKFSLGIYLKTIGLVVILVSCINSAYAQQGSPSASVSRARDDADSNSPMVVKPSSSSNRPTYSYNNGNNYSSNSYNSINIKSNEIRVEEFINYHKHELPLPKAGEVVALDVRLGNDQVSLYNPTTVLQVGFTTASVNEKQDLPPANIAIVIDNSGSMAGDLKLEKVKVALTAFVKQLREKDVLSLIVYNSSAKILLPATYVTASEKYRINTIISSIYPGGGTNLHGGLILGYQEALKNFKQDATNRVILLTDGVANEGVVNPQEIIRQSRNFNQRGVDLSTIGVGKDLNDALLRDLAKSGRGLYHFVADSDDIAKVFVKESESLVSLVAKRVRVNIEFDRALTLGKIYGYEPYIKENTVSIVLDDMNYGVTQVIMMELNLTPYNQGYRSLPIKVELSYEDVAGKNIVTKSERAFVKLTDKHLANFLIDNEVKKNFTIANLAQAIKDTIVSYEQGNYQEASYTANSSIKTAYNRYPSMKDKDVAYILGILKDYQQKLHLDVYANSEDPREE